MASGPQSGNAICVSKQLLRLTWASKAVRWDIAQSIRTAGCGPACPVVWEGRRGDSPPYPDPNLRFVPGEKIPLSLVRVNSKPQYLVVAPKLGAVAVANRRAMQGDNAKRFGLTKSDPKGGE